MPVGRGPQCFSIKIVFKHCLHLPFLAIQTRDALSQHLPWFSLFPLLPNPILSLPCHPCVKPVQISRGRVPSAWGRRSLQFALIRNYILGSFSLFFASETFLHKFDSRAPFFLFLFSLFISCTLFARYGECLHLRSLNNIQNSTSKHKWGNNPITVCLSSFCI